MNAKAIWEIVWSVLFVDGWSVVWRTSILTLAFGLLGILGALLCYRVTYRRGWLKLSWKHERFYEKAMLVTWFIGLPLLGVTLGATLGACWAGGFLIKTKKLGERVGLSTFQVVAAGVASANFPGSEAEKAKLAQAYLRGEQRIAIKELHTYNSHHAGQASAESICRLLAASSDGHLHHATVWAVEKTMDTIAYVELGDQGDILYKLANKVVQHDRDTDNDGLVTVQEISEVACKNFLDRGVGRLWIGLMLQLILPIFAIFLLLPTVPPLFAWLSRATQSWWLKSKANRL